MKPGFALGFAPQLRMQYSHSARLLRQSYSQVDRKQKSRKLTELINRNVLSASDRAPAVSFTLAEPAAPPPQALQLPRRPRYRLWLRT